MTTSIANSTSGSDKVAELAREHPALVTLARAGWAARGVVYALVGVLAVPIALNGLGQGDGSTGDEQASQSGAIAEIAEAPLGQVALWLVGIGLVLYVIWRFISVALPADNDATTWGKRIGYLVSALVYASLAFTAFAAATGGGGGGGGQGGEEGRIDRISRNVMEMTGGRWLVGLAGLAVIALGAYFIHKGANASFREELEPGGVGPVGQQTLILLGQAGWIGRGVMMLLIGWFIARAAIEFDPDEASGIDGALRDATSSTIGAILALVVAVGLLVYGAFCVISAPRARLTGAG